MDTLLSRFGDKVNSVITGFDRIVFKGMIMPIMHAAGMTSFLVARSVLNKDFKTYAMNQSQAIVQSAEELSMTQSGRGITYIPSYKERKETLAHDRQNETGLTEGLIGVWSCVESCNTFRSTFDPTSTYPSLKFERSKCKHLYFYFDDPVYGFMSVRLQTWAPYEIQIALNGREWLRRSLDKAGCDYVAKGNKFLHIDDYGLAQEFLDAQARTEFSGVLKGFLPSVFPRMPEVVGPGLSYYWTYWQTEVAKDYIFEDSTTLSALMDDFQIHAMITGRGDRILKYFGSPVRADGQPYRNTNPEIMSRTNAWYDGARVRHWNSKNSVKLYNEHNVLRFEMTMNDPTRFKIYRHAENQDKSEPKRFLPMRKGIADTAARVEISKNIINLFTEHMATVKESTRLRELIDPVCTPMVRNGKRVRSLDVFGKDRELIRAISDPVFDVHAITNTKLQANLKGTAWAKDMSGKKLSGRITRNLRLLREHGLIKKLPNQRKYVLTDKGRKITTATDAALATSVESLLKEAA
ncbi:MAG: hypothetical protein FWE20_12310 [Defluviitaleaceae bacterium]|nr:hypothetical protein [Defluviitaleaceae bacterium]